MIVQFMKNTPLYKLLIHKNPKLLKQVLSSEKLQLLFCPESLEMISEIGQNVKMLSKEEEKKKVL